MPHRMTIADVLLLLLGVGQLNISLAPRAATAACAYAGMTKIENETSLLFIEGTVTGEKKY